MSDLLIKTLEDGVLELSFNRPEKKNALNVPLWEALRDSILEARQNDDVRVVLLRGEGGNFCAGVDLTDFGGGDEAHPFDSTAKAISEFDKPMVGVADGIAIGGGATMLFHCDLVYVGDKLRMRLPFVNLGLVPEFASSYLLQANIGAQQAAELFYTAEWIDAERAVSTGIAAASFSGDKLLEHGRAKAREMAQWPVNSLRETKRCLKLAHRMGIQAALAAEKDGMAKQAGSPENIEAITAFIEKRAPDFSKLG
jgi:enoyl-CoA hydratase/carnithine racemase